MEAKFRLIVSHWLCSDPGRILESSLAKFTTKEKGQAYLVKHWERLKKDWGEDASFNIREIDELSEEVDPE